jgi:pectate lyase
MRREHVVKRLHEVIPTLVALFGLVLPGYATVLVNDTWLDGTRTDPASPTYSENGTDSDSDGNLESAWFKGNAGTLAPVGAGGPLRGVGGDGSSSSWTTYFTPEASPVMLSSAGDQLKVTWVFTPTGVSPSNGSQNFRLAVVDTPSAARISSDTSPGSAAYTGYGVFMNFAQTFGHSHPFELRTRNAGSAALLSSSGAWTGVADGASNGNHGYDSGTQYTFVMTITRNATNGLNIVATMTGGTINNSGTATASYTDGTPNGGSYSFDTFALRPSETNTTAEVFDTSLLKVEFIPGATPPAIDVDPEDQMILVGQNALFAVSASGTLPLYYQWCFNTNSVINNATNFSMVVADAQLSDAGGYSVVVSNSYGSVTSAVAQLTVNPPVAPTILTQPQDQTNVVPGATATFSVIAGGSELLSYQWYYNDTTPVAYGNDSILTITNVQIANGGNYSVLVSNIAGSVLSSNAVLTVNTNPVPPVFASQPASQVVLIGGIASFSAAAVGTAPISYQWSRNGVPISGATSSTLTLTNVQTADSGSYAATASNSVGTATSSNAVLTVTTAAPIVNSDYNLVGFGQAATGGGVIPETDPVYKKVYTALDLANAIRSANKTAGSVKVIEIMNDLDLGWNEVGSDVQNLDSTPFRSHSTPLLHPVLLTTGVSLIDIKSKSGLTIFSANGAAVRHANFNIKGTSNIIVRNLRFDQMWEWDESSKGNYDRNDWDFITLGNGGGTVSNVWIDHCTFTKAYDGGCDIKGGANHITFSWNRYTGDDGATNTNSWVWQQINALESNKTAYAMYNFLRTRGFSVGDIVTIIQGHIKTHLMGANDLDSENAQLSATFHHQWFINPWDRLPRLRAGNVHNYNIYVDDTLGLAARRLRDDRANAMSTADRNTLNNTYNFKPFLNGSISTENGAVLVEKSVYIDCLWPLRNNQTDPSNPVYTGKIKALDTIYQFDSTYVRGNSTDPGNPLGPFQAPIISFSWTLPGNQLPYIYYMDDPSQLQSIVTSPTAGAGAGVLTWAKTNWLMTAYAPTAPIIVADPQSQTVAPGQTATFTVVADGSAPLGYQWYFNTNTPVANATNAVLTLTSVQTTNAGIYYVVVSNYAGSATSAGATLTVNSPLTGFALWQTQYFGCTNCAQAAADADPDGDGQNNMAEFLSGSNPTNSLSALRIISVVQQSNDVNVTWTTAGGRTNAVQATAGDGAGGYSTNFVDISAPIIISGSGDVTTNYVDSGGATNVPSRYYRVRLVP